jgi:hypothetical protein
MNNKRFAIILVAITVILTSLACSIGGITLGKDSARITVSLREEQINRILESSTNNIDTDDVLLDEITEVDMQDGILRVYGTYEKPDGSTGEGSYDVEVSAENGALNVEIVGVDVEGVELGDRRITRTNEEIAEGLEDSYDRTQGEVEYESVEIDNDSMTIVVNVRTNGRNNP